MQTIQKPQINLSGIPGFATFIKLTTKGKGEPIFLDMNAIESISTDTPYNDGTVEIRMVSSAAHHVQESMEHIVLELHAVHKPTADKLYGRSENIEALPNTEPENGRAPYSKHTYREIAETLEQDNKALRERIERYNESEAKYAAENRKLESRLNGVLRQAKVKKDQIRNLIEKDGELFAVVLPIVQMYEEKLGTTYGIAIPKGITNKNYIERLPNSPCTSIKVSGVMKDLEGAVSHWHKCGFGRMTKGISIGKGPSIQSADSASGLTLKQLLNAKENFEKMTDLHDSKMAKAEELCAPMLKLVEKHITNRPSEAVHIAAGFLTLAQECPEEIQDFLDQLK